MFYVFDLDGTLANIDHRLHHLEHRDWRAFFAACADDEPIQATLGVLASLWRAHHQVEIWSGRSDEVREQTATWLVKHGVNSHVELVMRAAGDHRPDDVVKREFMDQRGRPDVIFEDRSRVVEMWRAAGIACFQVAAGEF